MNSTAASLANPEPTPLAASATKPSYPGTPPQRRHAARSARHRWIAGLVLAALFLLAAAPHALAQDDADVEAEPVAIRIEIYIVNEVPTEGGGTSEQYVEATSARPGQVVEYRLFAVNRGNTTLPGGTVILTGPVPDGTRFVPNSATPGSDRIVTEFTGPGATDPDTGQPIFSEPPVLATEDGETSAIDPTAYTAVRWTLLEPMAPGQEEAFFYRVVIE